MKLDPITLLKDKSLSLSKKFYFISGNEASLIEKIKYKIIENFQEKEGVSITKIDSIVGFVDEISLFESRKLYLVKDYKGINEESLNYIRNTNGLFIFIQENSTKIKKIKNIIVKDRDAYLIDCYELDNKSKIQILNEFIRMSELNIDEEVYWFLVEKLDCRYAFLENSLNKILYLSQKDLTISNVKKLLSINNSGKEKIFFYLNKKNKEIIASYREKIITNSDVNEFYYYCKFFCQLIIDCNDEEEYNKKIPLYLFKERNFLIDIYRKYNSKKKRMLLRLLSSVEIVLRKENDLSLAFGLRFFLNLKKITTS